MDARILNVAIVDDDERVRRALDRLLRAAGFNPLGYASAEEFLARPARVQPDCLIVDIQLRGMSGFELCRRLTAAGAVPPVIFITAHEESDTPEQARQAGCVAYFTKPVAGVVLLAAIRRASGAGQDSSSTDCKPP